MLAYCLLEVSWSSVPENIALFLKIVQNFDVFVYVVHEINLTFFLEFVCMLKSMQASYKAFSKANAHYSLLYFNSRERFKSFFTDVNENFALLSQ